MNERILLIVDDEKINRKILKKMLENEYVIMEACDGVTALDILHHYSSDISAVILDIVMPEMDGYEVLKVMNSDSVLSKIPVIVSSQKENDDAEILALSLGAQDYIPKPYKVDIIRHRISNTIRLRETASMINKMERDEVTGLYNKHCFIKNMEKWLIKDSGKKYDLVCFGVERFQLINDTFGQQVSDNLLCFIANKLSMTGKDPLLYGYFGGSRFFVLLPHRSNYDSAFFAEWQNEVNQFPIDMNINLYSGIYVINDITVPVLSMCNHAELAAEKNIGKYDEYYTYYDDSLKQRLVEEQFITTNMQDALKEKQFKVYYQPKYDLINEYIAGAEALVRWVHPEKGFMSPGSFIPLFEKNGFITQLDKYVWEQVCADMSEWIKGGLPPVAVSVNVSRADLYNPRLTDTLLNLIAKYEIPIKYFHLEITESAYTNNPDQIILTVNKLRKLGFIVEMDDFGSGYSSLNMLAEMPIDVMKLDMRFIQHETSKPSGSGILSFVISLAKWLDLAVVAEGVETSDQISTLRSMDCNYVQGFYYAKPMCQEEFRKLLSTSRVTEMLCSSKLASHIINNDTSISAYTGDRTMVIIDDMDINRAVLSAIFEDEYRIVEKSNGSEAWDYIIENYRNIDIILLDLLMPVMDGFQLLERIRSNVKTEDLPVIITSQGDKDSEHRALNMNADDFIAKPYNTDIIKHRVHNVVASYRLKMLQRSNPDNPESDVDTALSIMKQNKKAWETVETLKPHFDIVRLVDPEHTFVYKENDLDNCGVHGCYSVWGKTSRCNNCISFKALKNQSRLSKLEYSNNDLYFVVAEYIQYNDSGAVIEMVTKLDNKYVDNIFDKEILYANLDSINKQLDRDELTGIFNRRYIDTHLEGYVELSRKTYCNTGIAMIDVDAFKTLNDTYGHLMGDEILKSIARLFAGNIDRESGSFVARFGGDEFLIGCRNISSEQFSNKIKALSDIVRHIRIENHEQIQISVSIGCVNTCEFPTYTALELIDKADKRLYAAKSYGKGYVIDADYTEADSSK